MRTSAVQAAMALAANVLPRGKGFDWLDPPATIVDESSLKNSKISDSKISSDRVHKSQIMCV